ncbi:MAG: 4Fe-4S binding protein, partial [Methanomassiliicoccales archaeon]
MTEVIGTAERKGQDRFRPVVDRESCVLCRRCVKECSFDALDFQEGVVRYLGGCVACGRCAHVCPTGAIEVRPVPSQYPVHPSFTERDRRSIAAQARSGGVLLSSCGTDLPYRTVFDDLLLDAAQVTNPSIDPLREPIETRTYLGRRSGSL